MTKPKTNLPLLLGVHDTLRLSLMISSDWYVGIDVIRFDNVSTPNPLYVMSGYTSTDTPLVKGANTNAYAEFRFGLNV